MKWLLLVLVTTGDGTSMAGGLAPVDWFPSRDACIAAGQQAEAWRESSGEWRPAQEPRFVCVPGAG